MQIGVFGSGMMGRTLGVLWLAAGHEVRFGARDPVRTRATAASIDPGLGVGSLDETARWGEAFLLAVPLHAAPTVGAAVAAGLSGKLVLDAGNAVPSRDGAAAEAAREIGSGTWVAQHLPGAHVVKAFNTIYAHTIATQAGRPEPRVGVPLVGDDEAALVLAERLVRDAGFEPVRVGKLADSARIDVASPVWNSAMTVPEIVRTLAVPPRAVTE